MSAAIEKLTFSVLLLDKLSQPAKGVSQSIQSLQSASRAAWMTMGKGTAMITGAGMALHAFTGKGRDFTKALGEVASLGAAQEELDKLGVAGKKFAMQFGENAAEVVRSGYDIQSAIPGLAKGALAEFTYQGALLAKAGKADAATITNYMGTMYGIFGDEAKKIGDANWVEQLTGKTAHAIKIFKTTGDAMSAAFTNVGSTAQKMGVSLEEQLGVMGTLQATMGGERAGTAYKAMMVNMSGAQKALNLSFLDADKNLLPMADIIEKIQGRVGKLSKDKQMAALSKAFGIQGAQGVVNMLGKTDALRDSIAEIGQVKGSENALKMAEAMTDPFDRLAGIAGVLRTTLGQTLLPAINAVMSVLGRILNAVDWLFEKLPPLRWAFATVVFAVTGLTTAWGAFLVVSGASKIIGVTIGYLKLLWAWSLKSAGATNALTFSQQASAVSSWALGGAWAALKAIMNTKIVLLHAATVAQWMLNAAMLASPLTWIVVGIMAIIAAVYLCIKYWPQLKKAAFATLDWMFGVLIGLGTAAEWVAMVIYTVFEWIFIAIEKVVMGFLNFWYSVGEMLAGGWVLWLVEAIPKLWENAIAKGEMFLNWLSDKLIPVIQFFSSIFEGVGGIATAVWNGILGALQNIDGWFGSILRKLAKIPGMGWLNPDVATEPTALKGGSQVVNATTSKLTTSPTSATSPTGELSNSTTVPGVSSAGQQSRDIPAGGVRNQNTSNTTNYGGITIKTSAPVSPGMLEDMHALYGGI